jgi:dienelactone hydrolase
MRLRLLLPLLCACVLGTASRAAEPAKIELYVLPTTTLTDEQFLIGARDGRPATIAAELRLPATGTAKVPALVMVHGSGGITGGDDRWSRELNDMGIATFLLDGFTERGIVATTTDQFQFGTLAMINDAYRALELLTKHPRIDATRIGLFGGSRGGRIALYASLKRFQRMYATSGTAFAVYLPFYAPCSTSYVDEIDVVDRPIRLFHGTADDAAPIAQCRSYVERLQKAGKDVELTEYVGAHHGFDNPRAAPVRRLETRSRGQCLLHEDPVGRIVNRDTGRPLTADDACIGRGATVGYDARAHAKAIADVKAVLRKAFGLSLAK